MSRRCDIRLVWRWRNQPLCQRYVSGVFRSLNVAVKEPQGVSTALIHWGVGHLAGGEREILGVWHAQDLHGLETNVMDDLHGRGVLRMETLTGNSLAGWANDAAPHLRFAIRCDRVVPLDGIALSESPQLRHLGASVSRLVLAGDRLASEIQRRLIAVTSRGGPFDDCVAAQRFVASVLYQEDRRLWMRPNRAKPGLSSAAGVERSVNH